MVEQQQQQKVDHVYMDNWLVANQIQTNKQTNNDRIKMSPKNSN